MTPFWSPLSTLFLADPPCFATPNLVRMMLRAGAETELRYAGDRMGPALLHGALFMARRCHPPGPMVGDVVVTCDDDGIPDVMRVEGRHGARLALVADADPGGAREVPANSVLAFTSLPRRKTSPAGRRLARLAVDMREALHRRPDSTDDPAETVREKYDRQAVFYARQRTGQLEPGLAGRLHEAVPPGGRMLVIGSGSGSEAFGLAAEGWSVTGIDFAPAMVAAAVAESHRRGLQIEFVAGDVRTHEFPRRSWSCALFTDDVFSLVPNRADRITLLRRLRSQLVPGGVVFLSARLVRRSYDRGILTLQRASRVRGREEWGDSHARWIAPDGALHRSFVHHFSGRQLQSEIAASGFLLDGWQGGHGLLRPSEP